jgi:tetratricopeptide (TPR) repeat protein
MSFYLTDPMSLHDQHPIRNLKEDEARFLWFYTCHSYMIKLENDDNEEAKREMLGLFREQYCENSKRQSRIDEFADEALGKNEERAIWWYTENSFLFKSSHIYSCRYIIKLICCQLKKLHKKYIRNYRKINSNNLNTLRLYRGQQLESSHIDLLKNNINNLISLNGFVSTTLDKDVAIQFVRNYREGLKPVLIVIDVDMTSDQGVPFADISEQSKFPEEREILFSIGAVFRIKSIKYDRFDQCYKVYLSLSQVDQLNVNKYIAQTYPDDVISADQSILFGKLLFDMGECSLALKHLKNAYNRLSTCNNHTEATYLNNIGVCYNSSGKKDKAFQCYEKALEIYKQTNDARGVGACYHNVSNCFRPFLLFTSFLYR